MPNYKRKTKAKVPNVNTQDAMLWLYTAISGLIMLIGFDKAKAILKNITNELDTLEFKKGELYRAKANQKNRKMS